jgi:hypothetical protein
MVAVVVTMININTTGLPIMETEIVKVESAPVHAPEIDTTDRPLLATTAIIETVTGTEKETEKVVEVTETEIEKEIETTSTMTQDDTPIDTGTGTGTATVIVTEKEAEKGTETETASAKIEMSLTLAQLTHPHHLRQLHHPQNTETKMVPKSAVVMQLVSMRILTVALGTPQMLL